MDAFTEKLYADNSITFYGSFNGFTKKIGGNFEIPDPDNFEVFVNGEKWGPQ